jgi:hypothetical protein
VPLLRVHRRECIDHRATREFARIIASHGVRKHALHRAEIGNLGSDIGRMTGGDLTDLRTGAAELVSDRVDDAVNFLSQGRAANPRLYFIDLWLAGSLALKGDLAAARSAAAESMKLRPEINSVASWRAENLFYTNPRFTALAEKTLYAGLRRAGFPDE